VDKHKVSVDTGSFIPGQYRVNPYSIADGVDLGTLTAGLVERGKYSATWYWNNYCFNGAPTSRHIKYALEKISLPGTDSYKQLALQKAVGKVGAADLALGEDIGEIRETIHMLRDPLSSLKKFLLDDKARNLRLLKALATVGTKPLNGAHHKFLLNEIRVLKPRTGMAAADAITSTWLELRYGLRPLCYLVLDVIEKICSKSYDVWDAHKVRSVRSGLTFNEPKIDYYLETQLYGNLHLRGPVTVEDVVRVHASVQYRQSADTSTLDQLGLTPRHLPEVAWELTRLSYVVDWLFSIGPWLASLRIKPNIQILGNTVSAKIERTIRVDRPGAGDISYPETWSEVVFHRPDGSEQRIHDKVGYNSFDRECNVGMSYLPHFTWGRVLDLFKVLDSISLIWQPIAAKIRRR
jgi:hypothetical protein